MASRKGELELSHFRSDRFAMVNGNWFFTTRENTIEGPFTTRLDAENALERYLEIMQSQFFSDKEVVNINELRLKAG